MSLATVDSYRLIFKMISDNLLADVNSRLILFSSSCTCSANTR